MNRCAAFLALLLLTGPAVAADHKPNVLWIIADDHAPYVMGAYGNKVVKTPNLDRLAAEGIRFDRAYCNSPVCTASRQSFLTGRYPRTVGVTQLKTALPDETRTLAHYLGAAGYETAAIGKMHFNSNLKHGFALRTDVEDHNRWLKEKGRTPLPAGVKVQPPWKPFKDPARIWLNAECLPFGSVDEEMPDTWFARQAVDYLSAKREKPFFLMVSFYEPHSPFRFPIEYRNRVKPGDMTVPKVGPEDDWQVPAIFRDLTDAEKRGIAAAYSTSVEHLDKNVGIVLDALVKSGKADDTFVVYNGDHGYLLGHHGRFEKHCSYEEAVRAPLVMRYPDRVKPKRSTLALVEFIDIAPTILETCGVAIPKEIQGQSLSGILNAKTDQHRERVFVEYSENEEAMVRDGQWKLVYITGKRKREDGYETGKPLPGRTVLLFDLKSDPGEFTNLAGKKEHAERVSRMTNLLAEHMRRTAREPDLIPKTDDVDKVLEFCLQPRDVDSAKPKK